MQNDFMTEGRTLPRNFGPLRGANGTARITGPCGDTMEFWLHIPDGKIAPATFTTDASGACETCASESCNFRSTGRREKPAPTEEGGALKSRLARIPIDPAVSETWDVGKPCISAYARSETARASARVVRPILALCGSQEGFEAGEQ